MSRAYDTRPNLEGYDALTLRGISKFVLVIGVLFGAQFLADRYEVGRWFITIIAIASMCVGLKVVQIGLKARKSGEYPPGAPVGPRYSDTSAIVRFTSPRMQAIGEILGGLFIVADAVVRLVHLWAGAAG